MYVPGKLNRGACMAHIESVRGSEEAVGHHPEVAYHTELEIVG